MRDRNSFLEDILAPEQAPASLAPSEELAVEEFECYAKFRAAHVMSSKLRLLPRQGGRHSFDYSGITGSDLNENGTRLVLHYEGQPCYTITLWGENLGSDDFGDALEGNRVKLIRAVDELKAQRVLHDHPGRAVVTAIVIQHGSHPREAKG